MGCCKRSLLAGDHGSHGAGRVNSPACVATPDNQIGAVDFPLGWRLFEVDHCEPGASRQRRVSFPLHEIGGQKLAGLIVISIVNLPKLCRLKPVINLFDLNRFKSDFGFSQR
jgi:hypothetical protein